VGQSYHEVFGITIVVVVNNEMLICIVHFVTIADSLFVHTVVVILVYVYADNALVLVALVHNCVVSAVVVLFVYPVAVPLYAHIVAAPVHDMMLVGGAVPIDHPSVVYIALVSEWIAVVAAAIGLLVIFDVFVEIVSLLFVLGDDVGVLPFDFDIDVTLGQLIVFSDDSGVLYIDFDIDVTLDVVLVVQIVLVVPELDNVVCENVGCLLDTLTAVMDNGSLMAIVVVIRYTVDAVAVE